MIAYTLRKESISYFVKSWLIKIPGKIRPTEGDRKLMRTHKNVTCVILYFLNQFTVILLPILSKIKLLPPESKEPSKQTYGSYGESVILSQTPATIKIAPTMKLNLIPFLVSAQLTGIAKMQ